MAAEQKKCLLYWLYDQTTSIEPVSSIIDASQRKEGVTTSVKWAGKKAYRATVVMISEKTDDLKKKQKQLTDQFKTSQLNVLNCIQSPSTASIPDIKAKTTPSTASIADKVKTKKTMPVPAVKSAKITDELQLQRKQFMKVIHEDCQKCKTLQTEIQEQKELIIERELDNEYQKICQQELKAERDSLLKKVTTLEKEVRKLKEELKVKEDDVVILPTTSSPFNVEMTPKKVKLLQDLADMANSCSKKKLKSPGPSEKGKSPRTPLPCVRRLGEKSVSFNQTSISSPGPSEKEKSPRTPLPTPLPCVRRLGEKSPMMEISKGSTIMLSEQQLSFLKRTARGKPEIMIRKLMDCLFDVQTLAEGCAIGARSAHNKLGVKKSSQLDEVKICAIKDYVNHQFGAELRLNEQQMNAVINSKCATSRRGLQTKNE